MGFGGTGAEIDGIATIYKESGERGGWTENRCERVEPLDAAFINNIMITSKAAFRGDERGANGDFAQFPDGERRFLAFLTVLTTAQSEKVDGGAFEGESLKNGAIKRKSKRRASRKRSRRENKERRRAEPVFKRVFELFEK